MSCLRTGGPGKEHGANKPSPTERVRERSKGDTTCLTTSPGVKGQGLNWTVLQSLVTDAGPCTVEERDSTAGRQGVHRTDRLYPQAQRKERRNKA